MFDLAPIPVPDLTGRTVLVTGAGEGIGAETVAVLAEAGARVFAGVYGGADGTRLAGATRLRLDVTDEGEVDAAVGEVAAQAGRLDALINNAGVIAPIGKLAEIPSARLAEAYAVNVIGLHRMTVAALPLLTASKGVVVNAGTGAATTPMEGWTAYCTSKAGARMMTALCALELSDSGVGFYFVGIPLTDTAMQGEIRAAGLNPVSRIPRQELVAPRVPATVLAHMCSAKARAIPGPFVDVRDDTFTAMMTGQAAADA